MNSISIAGAFGAGLLSFLSPCILPLLPGYLSFITGHTFDSSEKPGRFTALSGAVFFGLGFSVVFIALGAASTMLGGFLLMNQQLISRVFGVIVVILGLHMLGVLKFRFLYNEKKLHVKAEKNPKFRSIQAFLLGLAFAFGWTPCVGPILGGILTIAAHQEEFKQGMLLLTVYSLGLWLPFLITALFTVPVLGFLSRYPKLTLRASQLAGVFLVIMGLLLITGQMLRLTAILA